jgi:hypothetical protein
MNAPDGLADIFIGRGGNRAAIENHQIGRTSFAGRLQPLAYEQRFESRAIGLRGAASEILNKELWHFSIIRVGPGPYFACILRIGVPARASEAALIQASLLDDHILSDDEPVSSHFA